MFEGHSVPETSKIMIWLYEICFLTNTSLCMYRTSLEETWCLNVSVGSFYMLQGFMVDLQLMTQKDMVSCRYCANQVTPNKTRYRCPTPLISDGRFFRVRDCFFPVFMCSVCCCGVLYLT